MIGVDTRRDNEAVPEQIFREFDKGNISGAELYDQLSALKAQSILEEIVDDLKRTILILRDIRFGARREDKTHL